MYRYFLKQISFIEIYSSAFQAQTYDEVSWNVFITLSISASLPPTYSSTSAWYVSQLLPCSHTDLDKVLTTKGARGIPLGLVSICGLEPDATVVDMLGDVNRGGSV